MHYIHQNFPLTFNNISSNGDLTSTIFSSFKCQENSLIPLGEINFFPSKTALFENQSNQSNQSNVSTIFPQSVKSVKSVVALYAAESHNQSIPSKY